MAAKYEESMDLAALSDLYDCWPGPLNGASAANAFPW